MKNNNDEKTRIVFPKIDYTLLPNSIIERDVFSLSAWEIRILLYFFRNLHQVPQQRMIEEQSVVDDFIEVTENLSETLKATPNIVRMGLAALIKKGYLRLSRKRAAKDNKSILYYSLHVGLDQRSEKQERVPEAKPPALLKMPIEEASIEFVEEKEVDAAAMKIDSSLRKAPEKREYMTTLRSDRPPATDEKKPVEKTSEKKKSTEERIKKGLNNDLTPRSLKTDLEKAFHRIETGSPGVGDNEKDIIEGKKKISEPGKEKGKLQPRVEEKEPSKQVKKQTRIDIDSFARELEEDIDSDARPSPSHSKTEEDEKDDSRADDKPEAREETAKGKKAEEKMKQAEPEKTKKAVAEPRELTDEEKRGKDVWDQVTRQMHVLLDNMTFNTWLKPSEYYKYEDGIHKIRVESVKFYDKFNKLWGNLLSEVVLVIDPEFKFEFYSD